MFLSGLLQSFHVTATTAFGSHRPHPVQQLGFALFATLHHGLQLQKTVHAISVAKKIKNINMSHRVILYNVNSEYDQ